MLEKKEGIFFEVEEQLMGSYSESIKILFVLWPSKRKYKDCSEEKNRGDNRMKTFCYEMWRTTIRGGGGGHCENSKQLFVYDGPIETV